MSSQLITPDYAIGIARSVIDNASRRGLRAAVAVNAGEGLSLSVRKDELETLEHNRDKVLSVTVYAGQRKGSATTTEFSAASLEATVDAAASIARLAEPDPYAGLIDPQYLATHIPDLDLDHPWPIAIEDAITLAREVATVASTAEREIAQVDEAGVSIYRGLRAYADTQGFGASYVATRHGVNCTVVGTRDGAMQRGYWYSSARHADALESAAAIGRKAAARAVSKLGARKLTTRKAPVLFENRVAAGLVGHLLGAISGGTLYREASFLRGAAGTLIFPTFFSIDENPHVLRGFGSAPFDAEGGATQGRRLIDAGVLTGYILDSYSARRLALPPTGNAGGAHNLLVSDQGDDFAALLRRMDTGLLVTDLMGFGINLLTADYSRGASGFWVEHGHLAYPVEEITIAGNLRDMFRSIVAVGNDRELPSSVRTGSILIEEMTIGGD